MNLGTIPRDALFAERVAQLRTLWVLYAQEHDWGKDPDPNATVDCLYAVKALYCQLAQLVPPPVQRREGPAEERRRQAMAMLRVPLPPLPAAWQPPAACVAACYYGAGSAVSACGTRRRRGPPADVLDPGAPLCTECLRLMPDAAKEAP